MQGKWWLVFACHLPETQSQLAQFCPCPCQWPCLPCMCGWVTGSILGDRGINLVSLATSFCCQTGWHDVAALRSMSHTRSHWVTHPPLPNCFASAFLWAMKFTSCVPVLFIYKQLWRNSIGRHQRHFSVYFTTNRSQSLQHPASDTSSVHHTLRFQ